jgi:tRNA(Ile)-lysidine synthase
MGSTDDASERDRSAGDLAPPSWEELAPSLGLSPSEPVLVALSGGPDSVFLLHVLALARPRPPLLAVTVNHRLRGAESDREARFCEELCKGLGIDFQAVEAPLAAGSSNLEARARRARYLALCDQARTARIRIVATGHHADDALETMLLRWTRGSELLGLPALRRRMPMIGFDRIGPIGVARRTPLQGAAPIELVRPLLELRRQTILAVCTARGWSWCEDSSNRDLRFTRNRVRLVLLPAIERLCGRAGIETLRELLKALEQLEARFAEQTARCAWTPRSGGLSLARAEIAALPPPLLRAALWRLCGAATGRALGGELLAEVCSDLIQGKTARHTLPGGFSLELRPESLELTPPRAR